MRPEQQAVARLIAVFGEPRSPDPEAYLAEYAQAIAGYAPDVTKAAVDKVIRTATYWPRPAEVVQAMQAILRDRAAASPPPRPPRDELPPPTEEQKARARALVAAVKRAAASMDMAADKPPPEPLDTSRLVFEAMQDYSRNRRLHRVKQ